MRYRYRNRLTRTDVGRRVVIRRWVDDDERGRAQSDVVGHLVGWDDDGRLEVRTKDARLVAVDERDILAAKTLPE